MAPCFAKAMPSKLAARPKNEAAKGLAALPKNEYEFRR